MTSAMIQRFEIVLKANSDYVKAVKEKQDMKVQISLLKNCGILMQTLILDAGLANDYADYCKNR